MIDLSLTALAIITAAISSKRLRQRQTGIAFSTLLLFPPLLVFLNMWGHTVAVSIVNIKRFYAGTFQYSFTVYSHLLFGLLFISLSDITVHCSKKYLSGYLRQNRNIHHLNIATSLLFLPVGFINPIGFLPVITSLLSSITLLLHKPFRKQSTTKHENEKTARLQTSAVA